MKEVMAYIFRFHTNNDYKENRLLSDLIFYEDSIEYSLIASRLRRYETDDVAEICFKALIIFYYVKLNGKTAEEQRKNIDEIRWLAETASKNIDWDKKAIEISEQYKREGIAEKIEEKREKEKVKKEKEKKMKEEIYKRINDFVDMLLSDEKYDRNIVEKALDNYFSF
jgi:hypothetical protein